MKKSVRFVAMLLLLTMLFALIPMTALAADLDFSFTGTQGEYQNFVIYKDASDEISSASITSGSVAGMELSVSAASLSLVGTPTGSGQSTLTISMSTKNRGSLTLEVKVTIQAAAKSVTPEITKHPGGETIVEEEDATFVAKANNATAYSWEILTKDGKTYLCKDLPKTFPNMKVSGSDTERIELKKIPYELNGAKIRCQFTGKDASVYSNYATIEVKSLDDVKPEITKHPTGETVEAGESAQFVAKAKYVKQYLWVLTSPDGKTTYECKDASKYFNGLKVSGSDTERLTLENIPAELNGWMVQCKFVGGAGTVASNAAVITVELEETKPSSEPTEAPTQPSSEPTEASSEPATEASTEATTQPTTPVSTESSATPTQPDSQKTEKKSSGTLILVIAVALVSLGAGASGAIALMNLKNKYWD